MNHVTEAHELGDKDAKDAADPVEQLCHLLHPPKPGSIICICVRSSHDGGFWGNIENLSTRIPVRMAPTNPVPKRSEPHIPENWNIQKVQTKTISELGQSQIYGMIQRHLQRVATGTHHLCQLRRKYVKIVTSKTNIHISRYKSRNENKNQEGENEPGWRRH